MLDRSSNEKQLKQDCDYIEIGKKEGAKLAFGGEVLKRETPALPAADAVSPKPPTTCAFRAKKSRTGRLRHPRQGL